MGGGERTNVFRWICEGGGCEDARETGVSMLNTVETKRFGELTAQEGIDGAREIEQALGGGCHSCGGGGRIVPMFDVLFPNTYHSKIVLHKIPNLKLIRPTSALKSQRPLAVLEQDLPIILASDSAIMISALGKWLRHIKTVRLPASFTRPQRPVTLAVGNESCGPPPFRLPASHENLTVLDLDSASSAIVMAYYSSLLSQYIKTYVPLLAIPRADLSLRPELLYLFKQTGIDPSDVCTLDDVSTFDPTKTPLVLVDHNVPRGKIEEIFEFETYLERKGQVEGIIDHHEQEDFFSTEQRNKMHVHDIEPSGSCSSLVTKYIMTPPGTDLLRSNPTEAHGIATLLLAAILIDTANLTSKVTDIDVAAANFLAEFVPETQFGDFYTQITNVKMSIEGMTLRDILRRDYKEYDTASGNLGMSTIPRTFQFLRTHYHSFESEYAKFVEERGLSVHVIMTVDGQGQEFRRGGMVSTRDEDFVKEFARKGAQEYGISGDFITGFDETTGGRRYWVYEQSQLNASRKQIAPLVRGIMDRNKS